MRLRSIAVACALLAATTTANAQRAPAPANRAVYLDSAGVIRWRDTRAEVALFGANYALPSASDFRAPGYLGLDRKKLVDDDMAHFARMGWDGLRLATWGDWENADSAGNLIANEHLDLLDYVVAKARERGIYMLLTPIQTYDAGWPDSLAKSPTYPGFSRHFQRSVLGTDHAAIAAQTNYLRQLLNHVNPYTGVAYKNEPAILFVEMINEPVHHPEDYAGAVRYIDTLVAAVRSTGSKQIVFHNVSQDFAIAKAIRASTVQGVTFGWYPSGLNSGHELQGNYLRAVDDYPPMRDSLLRRMPRIVYEFDSPDLRTGYMYPAMARSFRSVGAQFASMFAYDFIGTASRNLGWQTHYLNLVYTPRKAMSAVIAAEAMRRLPRMQRYGAYPENTRFGDFRVSYEENSGVLAASDAYLNAGATQVAPPRPSQLTRVAGYGSSPVVTYDGEGIYFLDRLAAGVWRLEVYPDAVPVADPFEPPSPDKIVTRSIARSWPMTIRLPDLGASFAVEAIARGNARPTRAEGGRFTVTPGVYLLGARGAVDRAKLPAYSSHLRLDEFRAPATDSAALAVVPRSATTFVTGAPLDVAVDVVSATPPDSVTLSVRHAGAGWFRRYAMHVGAGYEYSARLPADSIGEGPIEYAVTVVRGDSATTFPEGLHQRPWDWNFHGREFWTGTVVSPTTPLRLFSAGADVPRLAFSRIGDAGRSGVFRTVLSSLTGEPALQLELPRGVDDYTASLVVKDRVAGRGASGARATAVKVRMRGVGPRGVAHLTLVEKDGTSWSAAITPDSSWSERRIPLSAFAPAKAAMLPQGFPGTWNYWMGPAAGRGGSGDAPRIQDLERVELSLRRDDAAPAGSGVEVEAVWLLFD